MKTVCRIDECTGCSACVDICSKGAISIQDTLGSLNAVISEDKCIGCGACQQVCQKINPVSGSLPKTWYQGWNGDEKKRAGSSSGGFATSLMEQFVRDGGYVAGCVFADGTIRYHVTKDAEEIDRFRGSKYVKSNPAGVYRKISGLLKEGEKVLFVGLPCHVAALRRIISEKYTKNLYTIDLICHGSPSARILERFFTEHGAEMQHLSCIRFRQKNKFRLTAVKKDGTELSFTPPNVRDRYTIAFLRGLFYTENCYSCVYAGLERVSDITLGDSWGSDLEGTGEEAKGISLALCQTECGEDLLKRSGMHLLPVDLEKAVNANHQLSKPSDCPVERTKFFSLLEKGSTVQKAVGKCYPKICFRQKIKAALIRLHLL